MSSVTYLDDVDHLLCLIFPALIRNEPNLVVKKREVLFVAPVCALNKSLLRSIHEALRTALARSPNDFGKVIRVAFEAVQNILLEGDEGLFCEILELPLEQRRERGVKDSDQVIALPLVDTLVVS